MEVFKNKDGKAVVMNMIQIINDNRNYLSEIDGAIGDGDHGINMSKGFSLCETEIKDKDVDFSEALCSLGDVLFNEIGGSMGPIYGLFFMGMGNRIRGEESIDASAFYEMLRAGMNALQEIVTAKAGDKTLMDALIPALSAMEKSLEEGDTFAAALGKMKGAAIQGKDATKEMIAKIGRASRLGERSRGIIDAGAASCSLILSAMADGITGIISN